MNFACEILFEGRDLMGKEEFRMTTERQRQMKFFMMISEKKKVLFSFLKIVLN